MFGYLKLVEYAVCVTFVLPLLFLFLLLFEIRISPSLVFSSHMPCVSLLVYIIILLEVLFLYLQIYNSFSFLLFVATDKYISLLNEFRIECYLYLYCLINEFFINAKLTMMKTINIIKFNMKANENANKFEKPVGNQLDVKKTR